MTKLEEKRQKLIKLRKKMLADDLPLKKGATKLVFGAGNADADILCVGEGPGYWEDQKGIPFVGNAGKFLDKLLELAGVNRDSVFITNVVHYRPPNNRDPEIAEIAAFKPYLDGIIDIINPEFIITLGRFSMGKFMPGVMISRVHGKPRIVSWKDKTITVVPMYHPAAGLRNGDIRRRTEDDFRDLGILLKNSDHNQEEETTSVNQMTLV